MTVEDALASAGGLAKGLKMSDVEVRLRRGTGDKVTDREASGTDELLPDDLLTIKRRVT